MILPVFGQLLPNYADFKIDEKCENSQKSQPKRHTASLRLAEFLRLQENAEKRKIMVKCMVFNQWFVNRNNFAVCVQTIENGTVILEGLV